MIFDKVQGILGNIKMILGEINLDLFFIVLGRCYFWSFVFLSLIFNIYYVFVGFQIQRNMLRIS